ncbi:uridine kinase [Nakamurella antarctica]|uniref:Uridine kinase n=1 Tax=Nakamurella antarctica TaxID=1902245 RepID=A0A3G8ZPR2_9ACTN|nr:uridine kinase [Nakamurella antarctica]
MFSRWCGDVARRTLAGPALLGGTRLLTIDGPSGSGKSTIAAELRRYFDDGVAVLPTDDFATWAHPFSWWRRLEAQVLDPIASMRQVHYLANDWSTGMPQATISKSIALPTVLILEGVSAGRREVSTRTTISCWVELPDRDLRLERAVARDGESSRLYLQQWQRDEDAWFAADGTRDRADITLRVS